MENRLKFRQPIFKGNGEFGHFHYFAVGESLGQYSYKNNHPKPTDQCTGIKDDNDNLIYEGDIVREGNSWDTVVEWDSEGISYNLDPSAYSYKIIGNIHLNPELLSK